MNGLFKSRKFLLALGDAVFSTLVIVLTLVLSPKDVDVAVKIIAIWQGVAVAVIVGITVEDAAKLKAGVHPLQIGK